MYVSKFNYVSQYQADQQNLLINFLTRSADVIHQDDIAIFSHEQMYWGLCEDEERYLMERGYGFASEQQQEELVGKLRERAISDHIFAVHLRTFDQANCSFNLIAESLSNLLRQGVQKTGAELILYGETPLNQYPSLEEFEEFLSHYRTLSLYTKLVADPHVVAFLRPLLSKGLVDSLVIVYQPLRDDSHLTIPEDLERALNELTEENRRVTLDLRLNQGNVCKLKPIVNELIRKGWAFLENFECRLAPADNETCFFGYWYSSDLVLASRIFEVLETYPQTEFCSMEKWIGINNIYDLVWKGRLPRPSFHFCPASLGLFVFTSDGKVYPCPKLAEISTFSADAEAVLNLFQNEPEIVSPDCQGCKFIFSCGGGCRYKKSVLDSSQWGCPPIKELLEVTLRAYFRELLEKSACLEDV